MTHKSMEATAEGLSARGVATLRYQFLYMEKGAKRPDPPKLAHAVVRAAAAQAALLAPDLPLFAGGRSFGGRMTSQTQAEAPLPGVRGLAFLGFPLHPAGKPGIERALHLARVRVEMLFVSGTRDALADLDLLRSVIAALGERATLQVKKDIKRACTFGAAQSVALQTSSPRDCGKLRLSIRRPFLPLDRSSAWAVHGQRPTDPSSPLPAASP